MKSALLIALLLAPACTPLVTGEDLRSYYGVPPHISRSYSNGKGEWWSFHLKDDGTDEYWIVNDTIRGYQFH